MKNLFLNVMSVIIFVFAIGLFCHYALQAWDQECDTREAIAAELSKEIGR